MWKKLMATSALAAILAAPAYGADTTSSMRDTMLNQAETPAERQGMENRMAASEWIGRDIYAGDVNGTRLGSVENVRMSDNNQPEYVILTPDAALNLEGEAYAVPYDRFEEATLQGTGVLVADLAAEDLRGAPRQAEVQSGQGGSIAMTDSIADDDTPSSGSSTSASTQGSASGTTGSGSTTTSGTDQTTAAPETQGANSAMNSSTSAGATADTSTGGSTTSGSTASGSQQNMAAGSSSTSTSASTSSGGASTGTDTDLTTSSVGNISAMTRVDLASIAQSDLNTAVVLSEEGEEIGRVDNVLTNDAGNPDAVVINAGTYLGGDDKQVAISTENAELRRSENGEIYMVTSLSRADLQGAPDYTAEAYESDADSVTVDPSM